MPSIYSDIPVFTRDKNDPRVFYSSQLRGVNLSKAISTIESFSENTLSFSAHVNSGQTFLNGMHVSMDRDTKGDSTKRRLKYR